MKDNASRTRQHRTLGIALVAMAACATVGLSGCAGYRQFQQGQADLDAGHAEEGLSMLRAASELAPDNTNYRRTYILRREEIVNSLMRQGDASLERGALDAAERSYQAVLRLQPDYPHAASGVERVQAGRRQDRMLGEATALAERGDTEAALSRTNQVLSENPGHRRASTQLKQLMRQQADRTGRELGIYPKLKAVYRTPVTLNFINASVRQVFESLKLASGLNYLLDKDVPGDARVTISVSQKPVEDVLRLILATNQLERRVLDEDTLLIYPNTPAKAADYREMVIRSFYLSNADINRAASLVKSIAKARDVFVDERLNLLVVRDSAEVIRLAEKLIAAQDMPESEVMLELEVMEISVNRLQDIGIHWPDQIAGSVRGAAGSVGQLTLKEFKRRQEDLVQISLGDPLVAAKLRAQVGRANLLANPRVRVRNRQSAKILIGEKVPVITTSTTANVGISESVSYLDVGLKLEIEPTIALDDDVTMKLSLEVSNILDTITRASGTQTYRLGTRNTSTSLRVRDGETNVLAGLIQKEDRSSNTGVPGFNELPLVNKLFGMSQDSDNKTEIVLLITPHIVRSLAPPGVGAQEFTAGTENAIGAAPIQLGTALPKSSSETPANVGQWQPGQAEVPSLSPSGALSTPAPNSPVQPNTSNGNAGTSSGTPSVPAATLQPQSTIRGIPSNKPSWWPKDQPYPPAMEAPQPSPTLLKP